MIGFQPISPLLPEIFSLHGRWRHNKDAVVCGSDKLNWGEFDQRCNQVANALLAVGLSSGDTVGVAMTNSIAMVETLFGIMKAGLVSVPVNLSVNEDAIIAMFTDSRVRAVIATGTQASRFQNDPPLAQHLFVSGHRQEGWQCYEELVDSACKSSPNAIIEPWHTINVIYSSGTTGLPKGIVHTHQGRRDWAMDLCNALRYHGGARTLCTIGLYSNISWVAMLCTLIGGGTLVVAEHFSAVKFLNVVASEKITHTAMVPIQFQRVIEELRVNHYDTTSMQAMMSCGSPLHEQTKKDIFEFFPCGIIELYGLTEGIITTLDPEDIEGRLASVGKPLLGTDIKILDEENNECKVNQAGEIVSKGRITMSGYLNRPETTDAVSWVDATGHQWIRSGDIGYVDSDGFLYIVDRKKDMILSGGQNIYPQDIEATLIQHASLNDVAVIGAKSSRWGETPIAICVAEAGVAINPDDITAWANRKLGKQQRIKEVIFVAELPRNPNGKLLKRELSKRFAEKAYD